MTGVSHFITKLTLSYHTSGNLYDVEKAKYGHNPKHLFPLIHSFVILLIIFEL